jgi:hypothetical protein
MTRYELEKWRETFTKDIFDNANQFLPVVQKVISGEIDEDEFSTEVVKLTQNARTYDDYKKRMADFIEEYAKELAKAAPVQETDAEGV